MLSFDGFTKEPPADLLKSAGIIPGKTYPKPIADRAKMRDLALEADQKIGTVTTFQESLLE